jgi:hypothetical protein
VKKLRLEERKRCLWPEEVWIEPICLRQCW